MGKKINDEYIIDEINKKGYICLKINRVKDKNNKNRIYITIKCENGHITTMEWSNLKRGSICRECSIIQKGLNRRYTDEYISNKVKERGYEFLNTIFLDKKRYILVKCNKGHVFKMLWSDFNSGNNCPYCSSNIKKTYEYVKEYIESFGYKLLSEIYIRNSEKLKIQCPNGHKIYISFDKFQQGRRCSKCKKSKGEIQVSNILNKYSIENIEEYRFDDCKFKYTLPFDFYLPKYNTCIEYDGELHFQIIENFGGLDRFINCKICDTIKNEYCKNNNIKLIRIPYWEFDNIEKILKHELNII